MQYRFAINLRTLSTYLANADGGIVTLILKAGLSYLATSVVKLKICNMEQSQSLL